MRSLHRIAHGIVPSRPRALVKFAQGIYEANGRRYATFLDIPGSGFTRAASATDRVNGALVAYAASQMRINSNGLLVESSRANFITNGQAVGASGINTPTGWSVDQGFGGINPSACSSGTDAAGYGYYQFSIVGTTDRFNRLLPSPTQTRLAVTAGLQYAFTYNARLVSGVYGGRVQANFVWADFNNTQVGQQSLGVINTIGATSQRFPTDVVTAPVGATQVKIRWDFVDQPDIGTSVNFTVWLGGVQFETGLDGTSYEPTTTGGIFRPADYPFIDIVLDAPFSVRAKWLHSPGIVARGGQATVLNAGRDTGDNTNIANLNTFVAAQSNFNAASAVFMPQLTTVGPAVAAARFADNDTAVSVNGGTPVVDNVGLITTGLTRLALGQRTNLAGNFDLRGYLLEFEIAGSMSNAQLQAWSGH